MKFICLTSLLIALCLSGFCQEPDEENMRENALKVFMDCPFCDLSYVRSHINYVNYVRDTRLAQVHVLGTSQRTGSGGTEYTFNFIGLQDFAGQNDTLKAVVRADATQDERRELRLKYLKIGLTRYVAQTPMIEFMDVTYTDEADTTSAEDAVDKWDFWVFRLRGNGWFNGEELYESKRFNGSISANRVTELWKFENWGFANYNENKYQLDSITEVVNSNENFVWESSAVRAINNHWSAGGTFTANSSTFSNIRSTFSVRPALEYNVFDYEDFNLKQIRFQYRIGYNDQRYWDTTIYNQIHERIFDHSLSMSAQFTQKWGSINFSTTASQYLHDTQFRKLTMWGDISWRIFTGFQLNIWGGLDFIHDQITLPAGGASEIEILTQQRLLATQYQYWGSIGFTYTFGSIYNNIVNPRFGN